MDCPCTTASAHPHAFCTPVCWTLEEGMIQKVSIYLVYYLQASRYVVRNGTALAYNYMSYWLLLRVSKTHETSKNIFDDLINAPECTFKFRIVQECCLYSWEKDTPPLVTHLTRPLLSRSRYCWKDLTIFANLHIWQHLFNGWVTKQRKVQPNGRFILWMVQPNRGFMQTESSAKWKVQPNICHCNQLYLDSQMTCILSYRK